MSTIGIIGGSALSEMEDLQIMERKRIKTPFGDPSDEFEVGKLCGHEVVFLPRHGHKHTIAPNEINYRANIYALKVLGVERILSVAAVGSLRREIKPLDVVLVDQFVDRTNQARPTTFFGDGIVAHIAFSDPVCSHLRETIYDANANKNPDIMVHDRGTYINMEGPAFSTESESQLYKSWGMDVIGMTNMAEARLCREAGICYATMAMVTDYDSWHSGEHGEIVSVEMIMENISKNIEMAKIMVKNTLENLDDEKKCNCCDALKYAVITPEEAISEGVKEKLGPILM